MSKSAHPLKPRTPIKPGKSSAASLNKQFAKEQDAAATMTAAQAQAGTSTVAMLVTPKVLHDEIARQIAAIP
jgi:hypothetical protein